MHSSRTLWFATRKKRRQGTRPRGAGPTFECALLRVAAVRGRAARAACGAQAQSASRPRSLPCRPSRSLIARRQAPAAVLALRRSTRIRWSTSRVAAMAASDARLQPGRSAIAALPLLLASARNMTRCTLSCYAGGHTAICRPLWTASVGHDTTVCVCVSCTVVNTDVLVVLRVLTSSE